LAVPAVVAGVPEIALVVPPIPGGNGEVDPAVLTVCRKLGLTTVFRVNGPAGIAALGFGTQSIPRVRQIVGPGSPAVTLAQVEMQRHGIVTMMLLGPTESLVIADHSADPVRLAADLLIEAEHGTDTSVVLVTPSTDSRRPGPSLYVAVCGRRDAHMPRNVQKDPESSLAWTIKDEVMRRGKCFYGKVLRGRSTFIAPRLIPCFNAIWGIPQRKEKKILSPDAQAILKVMRKEWEMGTRDLREASGVAERARFDKAMTQLQKWMKIIPSEVLYEPTFTYIWSLPEARFSEQLGQSMKREEAVREIARSYLTGAGMTVRGELARVTGLNSPEAGLGNWALVDEGFAQRLAPGVYRLKNFELRLGANA
jgi:hypothetical protein